jgi:multiple sugar transport system permease protein
MRKRSLRSKTVVFVIISGYTFFTLFPVYWTVTTSFKKRGDVYGGPKYIPGVDFQPSTASWLGMFIRGKGGVSEMGTIIDPLKNSGIVAVISSLLATLLGTMGAYALSRFTFRFGPMRNNDILVWIVSNRMMPPIVTVLALFIMFRLLGLLDTKFGLTILYLAFNLPIAVWIMNNFLAAIPRTIEEAAMIDGASDFQIFFSIVLPMCLPAVGVTFLLCFAFAWNEFIMGMILTFSEARTIPVYIATMHYQMGPKWWDIATATTIAVAPVIAIALAVQPFLLRGLAPHVGK